MAPVFHELHTRGELLEVSLLHRVKGVLAKKRNDPFHQVPSTGNDELGQVLLVVVVTLVDEQSSTAEEPLEVFEHMHAACSLRHYEPRSHLDTGLVAGSVSAAWLPHEADREASFSVYKADHPATQLDQPFLLVFRTRHVVTLDITSDGMSSAGYTGFSSIWPDAHRGITAAGGNDSPGQLHTVGSGMSP
jgi:hypothetical protein